MLLFQPVDTSKSISQPSQRSGLRLDMLSRKLVRLLLITNKQHMGGKLHGHCATDGTAKEENSIVASESLVPAAARVTEVSQSSETAGLKPTRICKEPPWTPAHQPAWFRSFLLLCSPSFQRCSFGERAQVDYKLGAFKVTHPHDSGSRRHDRLEGGA